MDKEEVRELLQVVKGYYPKFQINQLVADAWAESLKHKNFKDMTEKLKEYAEADTEGRNFTLAKLLHTGPKETNVWMNWKYRKEMNIAYCGGNSYMDQDGLLWARPEEQ